MVAIHLDCADRAQVEPLLRTGLFAGVTTNPAILDKAGLGSEDVPEVIRWATGAGARRVFAQVWGDSASELVDRGQRWRELSDRVVVKIAYSRHGIEAARELSADGDVLITAIHSAPQVLPVVSAGAAYLAPFVARMDAASRDGIAETIGIQRVLDATGAKTEVLAGSLRSPVQILQLAAAGVRNVTIGPDVWARFFEDEVTTAAVANFERLASRVRGEGVLA